MESDVGPATDKRVGPLLDGLRKHVPAEAADKVPQLLRDLPDPVGALQRLIDFYRRLPRQPRPADYSGKSIYALLTAFGNSRYLSNLLQNSPDLLEWVLDPENLERTIPAGELRSDLGSFWVRYSDEDAALLLARFKRKHMLRIAMRDLLAVAPLADIALDLSNLADVTIQGAHDHIRHQLVHRFGRPLCETESGQILCNFAVFAMGKLGGSELNYSSDIDLMYIHTGNGLTTGPVFTSNDDFTKQLALRLTNLLSMTTSAGFIYRVDLRLRPEGNAGELVVPLSSAVHYYFNRARDWELQMLLKARPVAGDISLGRQFLEIVTPRIYRTTTDFSQIDETLRIARPHAEAAPAARRRHPRREAGPGWDSRRRVPGAVPPAALRRPGQVPAQRRDDVRPAPPPGEGLPRNGGLRKAIQRLPLPAQGGAPTPARGQPADARTPAVG